MSTNTDEQGAAQAELLDDREIYEKAQEVQKAPPVEKSPAQALDLVPKTASLIRAVGGPVLAIRPQNVDEVWRLANAAVMGGFAPKGMNASACVSAIVMGSEVGIPAMAALQSIAVINGRPALFGDGALGVIRASGLLESIRELYEEKTSTAVCRIKRRGEAVITRRFSQADAVTAKLWGKAGQYGDSAWVTYPKRMLQMRARAWAMRDGFADVLKGFGIAEEMRDVTPIAEAPVPVA